MMNTFNDFIAFLFRDIDAFFLTHSVLALLSYVLVLVVLLAALSNVIVGGCARWYKNMQHRYAESEDNR